MFPDPSMPGEVMEFNDDADFTTAADKFESAAAGPRGAVDMDEDEAGSGRDSVRTASACWPGLRLVRRVNIETSTERYVNDFEDVRDTRLVPEVRISAKREMRWLPRLARPSTSNGGGILIGYRETTWSSKTSSRCPAPPQAAPRSRRDRRRPRIRRRVAHSSEARPAESGRPPRRAHDGTQQPAGGGPPRGCPPKRPSVRGPARGHQ